MNADVDAFISEQKKWLPEIIKLREIALSCDLDESLKWGNPCYSINNANVVLIHVFKEYAALLFFKGALIDDTDGILIQQSKNVQAARQIRFTDVRQIYDLETVLKNYIKAAIEIEKSGLKVTLKETSEFELVEEFQQRLNSFPQLNEAFYNLTPGRQRAYMLFFSGAKQSKTRTERVEKCIPQILSGKGLKD
ncbi:YdeI/OmpD-associated family protein [Pedobacter aquatilis]|uniref:YdeI/OmpD-associated family protein n=1 Tax=Pedobacter aquatilis TaxID=351343 RepID=UPI00292E46DA|nr:DUF1801 domain-containing protein [Pedobacter aquatilis]